MNHKRKIMNLILFAHKDASKKGVIFKSIIEQQFKENKIQIFQTFNAFKSRLKQVSIYDKEIFILLADSKKRLNELTSLINLLESKRIILILSDDSKATIHIAHQFLSRYFTYINDTYDDLCAVLKKMMHQEKININQKNKGGN